MSFRHLSSISSDDEIIDRQTKSFFNEHSYINQCLSRKHSKILSNRFSMEIIQACQVTMIYNNDLSKQFDEILIKQKQKKNTKRFIVYKGYLQNNEKFSFKSQHDNEYLFDIKIYVNGYCQAYLSSCCEYRFSRGGFRINRLFLIENIQKCFPCQRCRKYRMKINEEIPLNSHQIQTNEVSQLFNENKEEIKTSIDINSSDNQNELNKQLIESQTSETTNDNEQNFLQSFLALLRQGFRRKEIHEILPTRDQGNIEDFIIILFGITDEENHLHSIVNFICQFNEIESLKKSIEKFKYEKLILILHSSFIELIIEDFSLFHSIYILSKQNLSIEDQYLNIRGYYPDMNLIIEIIQDEISNDDHFISFESISFDKTFFIYLQLLKETILTKDNEGNLQKDFLDYCRLHYQNNLIQLKFIDEFEKDFQSINAIWWFTRKSFLRNIIQRTLRTKEIDLLFKIRFVLQIINQQIQQNSFLNHVYRIAYFSFDQSKQIKENLNGFISFGIFLNCSLDKPKSIRTYPNKETIIFHIETNNGIDIQQIRHSDSNDQILLSFDNIYQINSIEQLNEQTSIITLTTIDKQNENYQQLTNEMRNEIEGPVIVIQLGKLLLLNDRYSQADYLSRLLFEDNSFKNNPTLLASLAAIHHLLGSYDNRQNNHHAARLQFEQSLKVFLSFVPEDNQILSATYNNIGSMYYQDDQHDQAIIYHEKALQCQLKASSPDIDAIATYSGNIGAVYLDQKKYDQALFHYKRSLQILQQSIPEGESMAIATVYDRIASVYWRMDRPDDALPFYQKALQLELKYLPENSHKISVSYFNLSTAYAKLNRLDEAIDAAEKSVQQLLKSVPPDHPEVKENTEQLEGLRRRKWLQQLYR